jgi:hypothetical protein
MKTNSTLIVSLSSFAFGAAVFRAEPIRSPMVRCSKAARRAGIRVVKTADGEQRVPSACSRRVAEALLTKSGWHAAGAIVTAGGGRGTRRLANEVSLGRGRRLRRSGFATTER